MTTRVMFFYQFKGSTTYSDLHKLFNNYLSSSKIHNISRNTKTIFKLIYSEKQSNLRRTDMTTNLLNLIYN